MFKPRTKFFGLLVTCLLLVAAVQFLAAGDVLARAGGGGSSSGSDYGGGISTGASSSSDHDSSDSMEGIGLLILLVGIVVMAILGSIMKAKSDKARKAEMLARLEVAAATDAFWNPQELDKRIREIFFAFQVSWGNFDTVAMGNLLTKDYLRRVALELGVLNNLRRQNLMRDSRLLDVDIRDFQLATEGQSAGFTVRIRAQATDELIDLPARKRLFIDRSTFTEYWDFRREAGIWKLDRIQQGTASTAYTESPIANFAEAQGFYYDADFGWLMMPHRGAIFGSSRFGRSDINNHVIGYYRGKIVEFYTYRPDIKRTPGLNYLVAQAILPKTYRDIWLRRREGLAACPRGLRERSLEFGDFNRKFLVCAHPEDEVNSLELLTPNFMERIFDLPFRLEFELVDNYLYLYTASRDVSYDQMLQILAWAFDEMKM